MRLSLTFTGFGALASNLPAVKAAEEAGFDGVWYAEHICMHDGIVPATAFLCATERIEVGVVGLSIAGRHPGLTAMELASMAELAPGRVRAAVGLGVPEMVAKLGKKITQPLAETTQLVQSLRAALAGLDLNYERPGYRFEQYKLNPMAPPPPIDVMAVRPEDGRDRRHDRGRYLAVHRGLPHLHRRRRGPLRGRPRTGGPLPGRLPHHRRRGRGRHRQHRRRLHAGGRDPVVVRSRHHRVPGPGAVPDGAITEAVARGGPFEAISLFTEEVVSELAIVAPPDGLGPVLKRYADLGVDDLAIVPLNAPPQIPDIVRQFAAARP